MRLEQKVELGCSLLRSTSTYRLTRGLKKLMTTAGVALLCIATSPSAWSARVADPSDNNALAAELGALTGANIAFTLLGLTPDPFIGPIGEVGALGTDIALKNTPAVLSPPADITTLPTHVAAGSESFEKCVYQISNDNTRSGNPGNFSEDSSSLFFINYNRVEDVWSNLMEPTVFHPQADVQISVDNPLLTGATPQFPEGRHRLRWRAETSLNYVMDIALPTALMAILMYAESKTASKLQAKYTAEIAQQAGEAVASAATKAAAKKAAERTAFQIWLATSLAADAGLITDDVTGVSQANDWYRRTSVTTAVNSATQTLTVWDTHPPYFRDTANNVIVASQDITLEAMDFGGLRFSRARQELRDRFAGIDDCNRVLRVFPDKNASTLLPMEKTTDITWSLADDGPYLPNVTRQGNQILTGEDLVTELLQRVTVLDTQAPLLVPPAGFARYSATPIDLTTEEFPLGKPRVVDLADPNPIVRHTAPAVLEPDHRYLITWEAEDASENVTVAPAEDPERYTQIVTIKSPGTNTPPQASGTSANTVSARPVEILLTGSDTDELDGRFDPLEFRIVDRPANGEFEAPLYPYFIEDFRLQPDVIPTNETAATLSCLSADEIGNGKKLESKLGLLAPGQRNDYIQKCYCESSPRNAVPVDFVSDPSYVHITDDDTYFISDQRWFCQINDAQTEKRLSKWKDGEFIAADPGRHGVGGVFDIDQQGHIWWVNLVGAGSSTDAFINTFDLNFERWYDSSGVGDNPLTEGALKVTSGNSGALAIPTVINAHADFERGVIYVTDKRRVAMFSLYGAESRDPIATLNDGQSFMKSSCTVAGQGQRGFTMATDGDGQMFIADSCDGRIHKFAPPLQDNNVAVDAGDYVGWLGRCDGNLLNPQNVPYNNCDLTDISGTGGVSRGFQCTDETCSRIASVGDKPGQFDVVSHLNIDPNGVLYVADYDNYRVQRFAGDGTFAGEAKSTGTGINQGDEPGFVLGNMGRPRDVSVNSTSFHVLEQDPANGDFFLHIFKTLPFDNITDNSATVKYVSEQNFQGNDQFTFLVDDGIDTSSAATVSVSIARDFRPPENLRTQCFADDTLATEQACELDEDADLVVRLSATDPDGFLSAGGLDTHTFSFTGDPQNGQMTLLSTEDNAAVYRYAPDADYNGADSFTFEVNDGADTVVQAVATDITILPVPDPVAIKYPDNLMAARGFNRPITAEYEDVDADFQPWLSRIDWGDGDIAQADGWINSGRRNSNGTEVNPDVELGVGSGIVVGSHKYMTTGTYPITTVMENIEAPGTFLPATSATANIEVIEATVVSIELTQPADPVDPDTVFAIQFDVTNQLPDGWSGLTAANTGISIDVPDGLSITAVDPRCAAGDPIVCDLGNLAPGDVAAVLLGATVGIDSAREFGAYSMKLTLTDDGPHIMAANQALVAVSIADEDDDGSIDVDDAFPTDDRYTSDSDGDGLADRWERRHGFNPDVADDTALDVDGDGFTLLEEFAHSSFPLLAENQKVAAGSPVDSGSNSGDDQFGLALAGGDLNRDGFADVVIGAPLHIGNGSVFVSYGSKDGNNPSLTELKPQQFEVAYGRSVTVDDFDGNGYPDIAIGSSNEISIHLNNGEIIAEPDIVVPRPEVGGFDFGRFVTSGDIDGDGIADLVVTARPGGTKGEVHVFLSARGGGVADTTTRAKHISLTTSLGDSAVIADIDGDAQMDLLVGAAFNGTGKVYGFLGKDIDWATATNLPVSFVLDAPAGSNRYGVSIASGADIGGDGIDDLVVGAYQGGAGSIHVYDSTDNYWQVANPGDTSTAVPTQSIFGLDDGSQPGDSYPDQFGVRVAMGQLDTDAYADVVVGANRSDVDDKGYIQVFRGSAAGLITTPQIENGNRSFGMLGYYVAIPGDVDGDGFDDIAAGAPDIRTAENLNPIGGYVQMFYHEFAAVDANEDLDNDGVATSFDNCPMQTNTNQADLDGDGDGDACDIDIDGDGILNGADNCPQFASADQSDADGDGQGDLCDDDDDNDGVADDEDRFPRDPRYDSDSDSDGLPDRLESSTPGLNPNDPTDAGGDLDGDGRNNLDEFNQGADLNADDVPPEVTAPADVTVDAIGPFTPVALGSGSATDIKDGVLTATADEAGSFVPGRNTVVWRATDAAGNENTATQQVNIVPMVNFFGSSQYGEEGAMIIVEARLNGAAVNYPVTVPFSMGGTAAEGADFVIADHSIEIDESNTGQVIIDVVVDAVSEGEESIILTMDAPTNAVVGTGVEHVVKIVEENIAPRLTIDVQQAGQRRSTVVATQGDVTISVRINDPNQADSHLIDWSSTDNALVPNEGFNQPTFTFDPAAVTAGLHRVDVQVSDNGDPVLGSGLERWLKVIASAPVLNDNDDTDGDGLSDAAEGLADENQNGVDDYREAGDAGNSGSLLTANGSKQTVLQTEEGLKLRLGTTAFAAGNDAGVSRGDIAAHGRDGGPATNAGDEDFDYPVGIYDFTVNGLPAPGESAQIVLPLIQALPANAVYRKYLADLGWHNFIADTRNEVASTNGSPDTCPAPGSAAYVPGLRAGGHCLQLTIEDGGPNDADGEANGVIVDPGGVAIVAVPPTVSVTRLSVDNQTVNDGSTDVIMLRFRMTASTDTLTLNNLTLAASGSGNDQADVSAVILWADTNANGRIDSTDTRIGAGRYQSDEGSLQLQAAMPWLLDAGSNDFIVTYDF